MPGTQENQALWDRFFDCVKKRTPEEIHEFINGRYTDDYTTQRTPSSENIRIQIPGIPTIELHVANAGTGIQSDNPDLVYWAGMDISYRIRGNNVPSFNHMQFHLALAEAWKTCERRAERKQTRSSKSKWKKFIKEAKRILFQ